MNSDLLIQQLLLIIRVTEEDPKACFYKVDKCIPGRSKINIESGS